MYNGPDLVYTAQARTLKAKFDELVEQYVPDDSDLPIERTPRDLPSSSTSSSKAIEESKVKERSSKGEVVTYALIQSEKF